MDHALRLSRLDRLPERIDHQIRTAVRRYSPADHAAAEDVQHDGELARRTPASVQGQDLLPEGIGVGQS